MTDSLTCSSYLEPSYGAHPTIVSDIILPIDHEIFDTTTCSLYIHYALPPLLFVDPYELDMRTESYKVVAINGTGAKELERPVHALPLKPGEVSGVDLVIKKTLSGQLADNVQVQLPIHVRYGEPSSEPYVSQVFNAPSLILACPSASPRVPLCSRTVHAPIVPSSPSHRCFVAPLQAPLEISAPLGNPADLPTIELGTSAVILACFAWVAWEAWKANLRIRREKVKTT